VNTPDWPKRYVHPYVLELERRYAIAVEALWIIECATTGYSGLAGNACNIANSALSQCPPLPKEVERE
jgi:hypothetical protein